MSHLRKLSWLPITDDDDDVVSTAVKRKRLDDEEAEDDESKRPKHEHLVYSKIWCFMTCSNKTKEDTTQFGTKTQYHVYLADGDVKFGYIEFPVPCSDRLVRECLNDFTDDIALIPTKSLVKRAEPVTNMMALVWHALDSPVHYRIVWIGSRVTPYDLYRHMPDHYCVIRSSSPYKRDWDFLYRPGKFDDKLIMLDWTNHVYEDESLDDLERLRFGQLTTGAPKVVVLCLVPPPPERAAMRYDVYKNESCSERR